MARDDHRSTGTALGRLLLLNDSPIVLVIVLDRLPCPRLFAGANDFYLQRSKIDNDNDEEDDYDSEQEDQWGFMNVSFVADRDLDNAGPRASDGSQRQ
jgi:hypothetical protein